MGAPRHPIAPSPPVPELPRGRDQLLPANCPEWSLKDGTLTFFLAETHWDGAPASSPSFG